MSFSLNKTKTTISGTVNFKNYSIDFNDAIYNELIKYEDALYNAKTASEEQTLLEAIEEYILNVSAETSKNSEIDPRLKFDNGKYYLIAPNGTVSLQAVPNSLMKLMISARQEGITIEPYIKCWTLFLQNPNFTPEKAELFGAYISAKYVDQEQYDALIEEGYSEDRATELSTYDEVAISRSGLLLTYKYVDIENGDIDKAVEAFNDTPNVHAEDITFLPPVMGKGGDKVLVNGVLTHNVTIGSIHELPSWSYVNCNDYTSCVKGLHLGSQTYIRCFGGRTAFLLNCLTSPSDIGAIVHNSVATADRGALRVLRYYPVSVNIAPNRGRYHESTLLDRCAEDWDKLRQSVIEETNAKIKELKKLRNFVKSI